MGERNVTNYQNGADRVVENLHPGMVLPGGAGETLTGFSPRVPNPEYFPFIKTVLSFIAINLDLPYALLLLDPSDTNFSGWRGAIDQARIVFRRWQQWYVEFFHCEVYRWLIRNWQAESSPMGRALRRQKINSAGCTWNLPTWKYIEPLKDASADLLRVKHGLISPRRLHAEHNQDVREIQHETIEDNAEAIREAIQTAEQLNAQFPTLETPVHWRELLALPAPDGVTLTIGQDLTQQQQESTVNG